MFVFFRLKLMRLGKARYSNLQTIQSNVWQNSFPDFAKTSSGRLWWSVLRSHQARRMFWHAERHANGVHASQIINLFPPRCWPEVITERFGLQPFLRILPCLSSYKLRQWKEVAARHNNHSIIIARYKLHKSMGKITRSGCIQHIIHRTYLIRHRNMSNQISNHWMMRPATDKRILKFNGLGVW